MPTYVYACSACSQTFEKEQRIVDPPLDRCDCGSEGTVKRVIQPVAISFNGPGFYVTDSKPCSGEPSSCDRCSTAE